MEKSEQQDSRPVFWKEYYLLCGGWVCATVGSNEELRRSSLKEMMVRLVKWGMTGEEVWVD